MKSKIAALLLSTIFAISCAAVSAAAAPFTGLPEMVRIGLESRQKEKDSIAIGNGAITFGYEQGGRFVACGVIAGSPTFAAVPAAQGFVRVEVAYSDYAQAAQAAAGNAWAGYTAFPGFVAPGEWYVYLGGFNSDAEMTTAKNAIVPVATVLPANATRTGLVNNGKYILLFDSAYKLQVAGFSSDVVGLDDRSYRGRIEFGRYAGKKLTAVNVLPLEEYLYSVVPSEMPQSWHMEALKAQACAARSYTATRLGHHGSAGYDLCDSTHCQVFTGRGGEAATTTTAVNETRGLLIYHNDQPIEAFFFSSSGGSTDNSENVWSATLPYLRAVPELNEPMAKQWSKTFTMTQITALLSAANIHIGTATGLSLDRIENGRVQSLTIRGTSGTKTFVKEEIRNFFTLDSRNFTISGTAAAPSAAITSILRGNTMVQLQLSSLVAIGANGTSYSVSTERPIYVIGAGGAIYPLTEASRVGPSVSGVNAVTFVGSGWGHGVGMSQHGAKGMAEMGYSFVEILRWYYSGVEVR